MIRIAVYLVREKKEQTLEMPEGSTVKDLVKKLGYSVQGVVVLRNSTPLLEVEELKDNDKLNIFITASGG